MVKSKLVYMLAVSAMHWTSKSNTLYHHHNQTNACGQQVWVSGYRILLLCSYITNCLLESPLSRSFPGLAVSSSPVAGTSASATVDDIVLTGQHRRSPADSLERFVTVHCCKPLKMSGYHDHCTVAAMEGEEGLL